MKYKIAIAFHFMVMVCSVLIILFSMQQYIEPNPGPHPSVTVEDDGLLAVIENDYNIKIREGIFEDNAFIFVGLWVAIVLADMICYWVLNPPSSLIRLLNKTTINTYKQYLEENIKHGMSRSQCDEVIKKWNDIHPKNEITSLPENCFISFHITTYKLSFSIITKIIRGIVRFIQALLLIIISVLALVAFANHPIVSLFGDSFLYVIWSPLIQYALLVLTGIYMLSTNAKNYNINSKLTKGDSKYIQRKTDYSSFRYCSGCNKIVDKFTKIGESYQEADFNSPFVEKKTTYKEEKLGSITTLYEDGSESTTRYYTTAPDETTLTAESYTFHYKKCPFCGKDYTFTTSETHTKVIKH